MNSNKMKRVLLISVLLIAFSACDKAECESQNPIFIENNPTSIAYKEELVKEISRFKESELRYWLKKYVKEGDQEYLLVYVQGEDLCAVSQIEVNEWTGRLKHIQEKKGCLLYTSPSPRDLSTSRMPSSA